MVDQVLKAYLFELSLELSVFVGLIITNCIVMGRAEGYAMQNPPLGVVSRRRRQRPGLRAGAAAGRARARAAGAGKVFGFTSCCRWLTDGGWYVGERPDAAGAVGLFLIALLVWLLRTWKPELQEKD